MRGNVEAGCEMGEILMARCQIKIFQRYQDLLTFDSGIRDGFKIDGGIQNEKQNITCDRHLVESCNSNQPCSG